MSRCIYIVDDDAEHLASLKLLLSSDGTIAIRCFPSGASFLEECKLLEPGVLLLDFEMPKQSGLDVLIVLHQEANALFAPIMLTGHANIALVVDALKAGAIDFLEKPYSIADLSQAVQSAFKRLAEIQVAAATRSSAVTKLNVLSPREKDVLNGLLEGRTNNWIGHNLEISPRTVEIYRGKLMKKLGVHSLSAVLRVTFAAGYCATA